ncbi:hypothetical protein C6502_09950 [Candidatus Poribacteria bacterium]|nr:MAG: hypothetical protein C6502_09950 [Candidatus Poribacteria bacterium]
MEQRKILSLATTTLLLIVVFAHLTGCGDVGDETVTERLRFTEFFLLPTAPYYRKSYIEHIPDEEIATREVDFEAKIVEIQKVYRDLIKAYREEDMSALTKTLDTSQGIEWGTLTGTSHGWNNIKGFLEAKWIQTDCMGIQNWENWELTDFYIRPKNIKAPWEEASATAPMFFQDPGSFACVIQPASFYLTNKSSKSPKWRIHQINGSRYFTDPRYKVPDPKN